MMNVVLIASLLVNIALVAGIFWMGRNSQKNMVQLVSVNANDQILLMERVLADLGSKDPVRYEALTNWLTWNIEAQKRLRYKADTGEK
jgi:hypothetical protein